MSINDKKRNNKTTTTTAVNDSKYCNNDLNNSTTIKSNNNNNQQHNNNNNNNNISYINLKKATMDKYKLAVEQDGINARNLIAYGIPNEKFCTKKQREDTLIKVDEKETCVKDNVSVEADSDSSRTTSRASSNKNKKRNNIVTDIRARYWAYLFDNLKRAVDEIYQTCENDESVIECKEVIMIMEHCTNDFKSLIKRFQIIKDYEATTGRKPSSLAWEVRKSSPQKGVSVLFDNRKKVLSDDKITYENLNDDIDDDVDDCDDGYSIDLLNHETFNDLEIYENDELSSGKSSDIINSKFVPSSITRFSAFKKDKFDSNTESSNMFLYSESLTNFNSQMYFDSVNNDESDRLKTDFDDMDYINDFINKNNQHNKFNFKSNLIEKSSKNKTTNSIYTNSRNEMMMMNNTQDKLKQQQQQQQNIDNQLDSSITSLKPYDPIDEAVLKVYEEEENLTLALEAEQDIELLSVMEQEDRLTKQLSVEHLLHLNHLNNAANNVNMKSSKKANSVNYSDNDDNSDFNRKSSSIDYEDIHNIYLNEFLKKIKEQRGVNQEFDIETDADSMRTPGRASQIHEKLLSQSILRKTSPSEHRRKHEEKQARAQEKREQFYEDRTQKLRELTRKIEEVRKLKNDLLKAKKSTIKSKLQRAEEKRLYLLEMKAKKAADEEQKAHEILFINNLKEQHRKHDILERYEKKHEIIRHNLEEERNRKQEEQKAKELAAGLRRKEIEAKRIEKLKQIEENRRLKQSKIEQLLQEKEKDRIETAKAKERTREQRLAVLEAQHQATKEEKKRRILQKQEEWSRRHESNLEEIRKKAFEMSILHFSSDDHQSVAPTPVPYDKPKYCNVCNTIIRSDLNLQSHLRGLKHQQIMNEANQGRHLTKPEIEEYNLKCIVDIPKDSNDKEINMNNERKIALKKRLKKLKNKISKSAEYESGLTKKSTPSNEKQLNSENKAKITKLIKLLSKNLQTTDKGPWPQNKITQLDKTCREANRLIDKSIIDQNIFMKSEGITTCVDILDLIAKSNDVQLITAKSISNVIDLITVSCKANYENCLYMIFSDKMATILEILQFNFDIMLPDNFDQIHNKLPYNQCVSSLIHLVSTIFFCLSQNENKNNNNDKQLNNNNSNDGKNDAYVSRSIDVISYIVSLGIFDKISIYFSNVIEPFNGETQTGELLINCLNLLTSVTKYLCLKKTIAFGDRKIEDPSLLISTFRATNLVGIVSMLYGMLHRDSPLFSKNEQQISNSLERQLTPSTIQIAIMSLKMLNQMAILDLKMVQNILGEESMSLQLRHISSYLLFYCTKIKSDELLHEIILLIGYFTVLNNENQIKIELGTPPTVLQLLCTLPFNYFSDSKLTNILHPTLICCCYKNEKNKSVLATEVSSTLLANYLEEKLAEGGTTTTTTTSTSNNNDDRFNLSQRFPVKLWTEAAKYFAEKQTVV